MTRYPDTESQREVRLLGRFLLIAAVSLETQLFHEARQTVLEVAERSWGGEDHIPI